MIKPLVLASHNWKVLLKSLVYQALLLALLVAVGYLVFGNLVYDIGQLLRNENVRDFLTEVVGDIVNGTFDTKAFSDKLTDLIETVRGSVSQLRLPFGGVTMSYVLLAVMVIVYRMLVSLADVATMCSLEEFITSNAQRPFTWFVIKKQGVSWRFVLLQTALALPLDMLIVFGCVGFYLVFLITLSWWAIIPIALIGMVLYVARLSMFAYTLPAVVCKEGSTRLAFRKGLGRAMLRFWQVFWKTLVVVAIMTAISVLSMLYVNNAIAKTALATVPNFVLFFYLKCVNLIEYFRFDNRPFFYKRIDIEGTDSYNRKRQRALRKAQRKR